MRYNHCELCGTNYDIGERHQCEIDEPVYYRAHDFICKDNVKGEIDIEDVTTGEKVTIGVSNVKFLKKMSNIYNVKYLCRQLEKNLKSISNKTIELTGTIGDLNR